MRVVIAVSLKMNHQSAFWGGAGEAVSLFCLPQNNGEVAAHCAHELPQND